MSDDSAAHDGVGDRRDSLYETGLKIRKEVVGAEYVERALAQADELGFSAEFQRIVTEYCWGAGWGRNALSRRDRSLLNLAMIGTLNRSQEFKLHLRGALRNGCTKDEIEDTLIQLGIYAGIPAGVEAFRLALEVFAEEDAKAAESGSGDASSSVGDSTTAES